MAIVISIVVILMLLCAAIVLIKSAVWALFFRILNLGFLPAGIGIGEGIAETGVYVLPFFLGSLIEIPLHFLLTLWINIVDFACAILSVIPFVKELLYLVKVCPDLDLTTHGIDPVIGFLGLTGHRNFITHSVLNPYILMIVLAGLVLYLFGFVIKRFLPGIGTFICSIAVVCVSMSLFIHSAHLFADCMPKGWNGSALIKVHIGFIKFVLFPILSKLWLLVNGIFAMVLGCKFFGLLPQEDSSLNK